MNRSKGFTLIELLVVVAIIALLISILVPAVQRALRLAAEMVCGKTLKGLDDASYMFSVQHDGQYPMGWNTYDPINDPTRDTDFDPLTPEGSFGMLILDRFMTTKQTICAVVGGRQAADVAEMLQDAASIERYVHYAYQDLSSQAGRAGAAPVSDGFNYLPSPSGVTGDWPVFADRGKRIDSTGSAYDSPTGGGNHDNPSNQNVIGSAHGVAVLKSDTSGGSFPDEAMINYGPIADDDIYKDQSGGVDIGHGTDNDAYLVSSSYN